MSPESAEICKLALYCFITTKISFANMIGALADVTDAADKFDILRCVGDDQRVGPKCLRPGYGFGGPCFPRDNRALGAYARSVRPRVASRSLLERLTRPPRVRSLAPPLGLP